MNWKVSLVFILGVIVGGFAVWMFTAKPVPDRYVLTRDLNLAESYFFEPKGTAPARGVLKAGTRFEVEWRHSRAEYVVVRTVVDRETLESVSRPDISGEVSGTR